MGESPKEKQQGIFYMRSRTDTAGNTKANISGLEMKIR